MKPNKELEKRIKERETEVQRAYDMATEEITHLKNKRIKLENEMSRIDDKIESYMDLKKVCRQRVIQQGYNPTEVLGV